ncbi:MAG: GNAT family N-acetyltransferase [Isosphaeraceae bacterium]
MADHDAADCAPIPSVVIRPPDPASTPQIRALLRHCRGVDLGFGALIDAPTERLLDVIVESQSRAYQGRYPGSGYQVIEVDAEPRGVLFLDRGRAADRVVDIVILPEHRGRGIGTAALRHVLSEAAAAGRPVHLSVRHGNPALRLYERLGFLPVDPSAFDIEMTWIADGSPSTEAKASPPSTPSDQRSLASETDEVNKG